MVAARGMHKGVYASDITGVDYVQRVDDHLFTQAVLGWTAPSGGEPPVPGTLRRRHVVGVDSSGRRHSVSVPTITADLWAAPGTNTWQILDDAGLLDIVTPTGLVGEALTLAQMTYYSTIRASAPSSWWRMADPGGSILHDIGFAITPVPLIADTAAMGPYSGPSSDGFSFCRIGNQSIYINQNVLTLGVSWSIEFWAWVFLYQNAGILLMFVDFGSSARTQFTIPGGNTCDFGMTTSGGNAVSTAVFTARQWHHVVGTYDHVTMRLYVDGLPNGTRAGVFGTPGPTGFTALQDNNGANRLIGFVSDVAIYPTVLSAADVAGHFAAADQVGLEPNFAGGVGSYPNASGATDLNTADLAKIYAAVHRVFPTTQMPAPTNIIDSLSAPPFASLQQVLDTGGPYGSGDHTLTSFHTSGAFVLPAGTYDVGGTYGVLAQINGAIPARLGYQIGWSDLTGNYVESEYIQPFAQIIQQHVLPITGAFITTTRAWMYTVSFYLPWSVLLGAGARVGLHVEPHLAIDLYYLCVL